jgi:hypothetical protein
LGSLASHIQNRYALSVKEERLALNIAPRGANWLEHLLRGAEKNEVVGLGRQSRLSDRDSAKSPKI